MLEVAGGLRWLVRAGASWRLMPPDLPPWYTVYQQTQCWLNAGVFEEIVHDLRRLLQLATDREAEPTAAIFDGRTLQSTPESGGRAGYDGHKRRKGSKVHKASNTAHFEAPVIVERLGASLRKLPPTRNTLSTRGMGCVFWRQAMARPVCSTLTTSIRPR